jgi:hypothetical protein
VDSESLLSWLERRGSSLWYGMGTEVIAVPMVRLVALSLPL